MHLLRMTRVYTEYQRYGNCFVMLRTQRETNGVPIGWYDRMKYDVCMEAIETGLMSSNLIFRLFSTSLKSIYILISCDKQVRVAKRWRMDNENNAISVTFTVSNEMLSRWFWWVDIELSSSIWKPRRLKFFEKTILSEVAY